MANLVISGDTSGSVTLAAPAVSGTTVLTLPTTSGTLVTTAGAASLTTSGNLTFTGTGNRILGDFSNATQLNRVAFQTSTTNGATSVGVLPNGTGTTSAIRVFENSDPTLSNFGDLIIIGGSDVRLRSDRVGAISYLPLTMYTGGSERLRIDTSGNVGIGTTSAQSALDVGVGSTSAPTYKGHIRLNGGGLAANGGLEFFSASFENGFGWRLQTPDEGGGSTPIVFQARSNSVSWTERMRIDSAGSVWIGGSTTGAGPAIIGKGGAGGGCILQFYKPNSGATNVILNYFGATYVGGMNMDNTSTSFITSSDIRMKKDVVDAPSAISDVNAIRIVSHGWKNDSSKVKYGVIAQELYSVAPQSVSKGDDEDEITVPWSVDYSKLVPLLTKAIQELNAKVTALEAQLGAK
jgi:hypothetical protein